MDAKQTIQAAGKEKSIPAMDGGPYEREFRASVLRPGIHGK
jgi:hypothetical protein